MAVAFDAHAARMAYVIELLPDLPVIRVAFDGPVSVQDRADALDAVIHRQAASSYRRLMVDLTGASMNDASTSETIAHVSRLARHPIVRGMRIAYIGDASLSASVESLAALRGYFYQRFRSQASALRWLCGDGAMATAA